MQRAKNTAVLAIAFLSLSACGSDTAEVAPRDDSVDTPSPPPASRIDKTQDGDLAGAVVTPGAPYRVNYTIIGTPVVGVPVAVELTILSAVAGAHPVVLDYRIRDASSMMFAESQPRQVRLEPAANETTIRQQVSVVPQREGRFYLNVSASFETADGTVSTVTAIPIQVGKGSREIETDGELELDEQGEAIRILTND